MLAGVYDDGGRTGCVMGGKPVGERGVLANRLEHLFQTVHPLGRGPYTLKEVSDEINADAGHQLLSLAYLSQLRRGDRTEPSYTKLAALAKFFGVAPEYFFDDELAARTDADLEVARAIRDSGVKTVALRAAGLSPASLEAILGIIDNARRIEGLPAHPDGETEA